MEPHEQRVIEEQQQLSGRLSRLRAFVAGPIYPTLPEHEQLALNMQLRAMDQYWACLECRIPNFKKDK